MVVTVGTRRTAARFDNLIHTHGFEGTRVFTVVQCARVVVGAINIGTATVLIHQRIIALARKRIIEDHTLVQCARVPVVALAHRLTAPWNSSVHALCILSTCVCGARVPVVTIVVRRATSRDRGIHALVSARIAPVCSAAVKVVAVAERIAAVGDDRSLAAGQRRSNVNTFVDGAHRVVGALVVRATALRDQREYALVSLWVAAVGGARVGVLAVAERHAAIGNLNVVAAGRRRSGANAHVVCARVSVVAYIVIPAAVGDVGTLALMCAIVADFGRARVLIIAVGVRGATVVSRDVATVTARPAHIIGAQVLVVAVEIVVTATGNGLRCASVVHALVCGAAVAVTTVRVGRAAALNGGVKALVVATHILGAHVVVVAVSGRGATAVNRSVLAFIVHARIKSAAISVTAVVVTRAAVISGWRVNTLARRSPVDTLANSKNARVIRGTGRVVQTALGNRHKRTLVLAGTNVVCARIEVVAVGVGRAAAVDRMANTPAVDTRFRGTNIHVVAVGVAAAAVGDLVVFALAVVAHVGRARIAVVTVRVRRTAIGDRLVATLVVDTQICRAIV